MTCAYAEAYAAARSCLGALADISEFDDSCRYEHLLIDLDGIHGGDFPATYPMPGTRPDLLAHLEDEVDQMIELGGGQRRSESFDRDVDVLVVGVGRARCADATVVGEGGRVTEKALQREYGVTSRQIADWGTPEVQAVLRRHRGA